MQEAYFLPKNTAGHQIKISDFGTRRFYFAFLFFLLDGIYNRILY